jgi:signal peptidase
MFIGLLTTFGRSPYNSSFNSFILTLLFFSSNLFGIELARAQLVRVVPRNKKLIGLALTSVLLTLTSFSFTRYSSLENPLETVEFLGSFLIPLFAMNILASYLALLGGPIASIAYLGVIQLFECISPILPNPHWTIKALITTVTPVIGFLAVNEVVKPFTLFRQGLITRKEAKMVTSKLKNSLPVGWMTIAVAALFLFWGNSGLLGFQPSVIMSGSMQPLYQVGDMEIIFNVKPASIGVGDVIQYRGTDAPIIHRVIDKYTYKGSIWFKTKGDANNVPDPNPVSESQVMGKAVFTIPKLGWASITIRETASKAFDILTNLPNSLMNYYNWITTNGVYLTTTLAVIVLSYTIVISTRKKKLEVEA